MKAMQTQEMVSALADGQLQGDAFAQGVEVAARDPAAREAWHTYHLIGDVLRSAELAAGTVPAAFLSRFQLRLQQEAQVDGRSAAEGRVARPVRQEAAQRVASNDADFRWKLVAGFASLTAIVAIGWTAAGDLRAKPEPAQMAAAGSGLMLASGERGVMIRDPRLDEFLAAHRQLGGASALQAPAGFLRNATFEESAR
jgi:sigma-E factor negative regulatory protein RseA